MSRHILPGIRMVEMFLHCKLIVLRLTSFPNINAYELVLPDVKLRRNLVPIYYY